MNLKRFNNTIGIHDATTTEVLDILNGLKVKKSTGYDGFMLEHFVGSKENTSIFMTKLINSIIEHETWPDELKKQVLRPIYKKGDRKNLNNYRPVALLPVLNKIVEKFFTIRIEKFLNKFSLLNKMQFGYQKGMGTTDALHKINNNITRALNDGKHVGAVMIDLQKAFDTLEKNIILEKLYKHGIRGKMLNILNNYLTNRKCCVKVENEYSEWKDVIYGVPQGSILGPLIFLVYLNDIQEISWKTYLTLYADDIFMLSIHREFKCMITNLQEDFDKINHYLNENDLYMNVDKTCFMNIKTSHMKIDNALPVEIIAHDVDCTNNENCFCKRIKNVNTAKYLGMDLDESWKFYNHIDNIVNKIRKTIPVFYRVRNLLDNKNKHQLVEALVMSVCRYACCIYGTTSLSLIQRMQSVQNKAAKVLFNNSHSKKNTKTIFKEEKLLTIKQLINYTTITQNYFKPEFKKPTTRPIRNNNNWLIEPSYTNSYGKRNQTYQIPHIFNKLPAEMRKCKKYTFKTEIKKWVLNCTF